MDKITKRKELLALGVHDLRVFARNIGVSSPTTKRKEDLVEEIIAILSGEKQAIMTGEISGVAVKIKVDCLHPDKIVDLKIMGDFDNKYDDDKGYLPWFEYWGYDLQGAVYQEIVRQNTGEKLPFYLAAATKEKVTDLDIVHIPQNMLDFALDRFKESVEMYDAIKHGIIKPDRCEKCEYCKISKKLTAPTEADEFYFI